MFFYVKVCNSCGRKKMHKLTSLALKKKVSDRGSNVFYVEECGMCDEYRSVDFRNSSVDNPFAENKKESTYDMSQVRLPYKD